MVYGSNPELSEIARDGNEPIQPEAPIAAAIPTLPSYATPVADEAPAPVANDAPAPVAVPDPMPDAVPVAAAPAPARAPEVVSASDQPLPSYAVPRADVGLSQAPPAQTSNDSNDDPPYVTMPQDAVPTPPPTR